MASKHCYTWFANLFEWDTRDSSAAVEVTEKSSGHSDITMSSYVTVSSDEQSESGDSDSVDEATIQLDREKIKSLSDSELTHKARLFQMGYKPWMVGAEPVKDFIKRSSASELNDAIINEQLRQQMLEAEIRILRSTTKKKRTASCGPSPDCHRKAACAAGSISANGRRSNLSCGSGSASNQGTSNFSKRNSWQTVSPPGARCMTFRNEDSINRLMSTMHTSARTAEKRKTRSTAQTITSNRPIGPDSTGNVKVTARKLCPRTPRMETRRNNVTSPKHAPKHLSKKQSEEATRCANAKDTTQTDTQNGEGNHTDTDSPPQQTEPPNCSVIKTSENDPTLQSHSSGKLLREDTDAAKSSEPNPRSRKSTLPSRRNKLTMQCNDSAETLMDVYRKGVTNLRLVDLLRASKVGTNGNCQSKRNMGMHGDAPIERRRHEASRHKQSRIPVRHEPPPIQRDH